jgi:hypothetical protein
MFENVLVGVDGRSGGRDAISLASGLADPMESRRPPMSTAAICALPMPSRPVWVLRRDILEEPTHV